MKYEIMTSEYYSNCLIETLKAKIKDPNIKIYFCKPIITYHNKKIRYQMFHFMWSDGSYSYDFSDLDSDTEKRNIIFKGVIRRFDQDFARRYCIYRNS